MGKLAAVHHPKPVIPREKPKPVPIMVTPAEPVEPPLVGVVPLGQTAPGWLRPSAHWRRLAGH